MKKAIFLVAVALVSNQLKSEEKAVAKEIFAIHPKLGLGMVVHSSDFNYLNQQINCGTFKSGTGVSFGGGLNFELPFNESFFGDFGIQYKSMSGSFEIDRFTDGFDIKNQKPVSVNTNNKIESNLGYLKLEPGIKYKLADEFINGPIFLNVGLGFGIPISNTFTQTEDIKSPQNAYFTNYSGGIVQSRKLFDGDISDMTGLLISLKGGVENQLKIGTNLSFTQAIGVEYNLNSIVSHSAWNALDINFALGLRYSFKEAAKEIPPPPPAPVIEQKPVEKPKPILALKFDNISNNDFVLNTGNELAATQTLLNAVFFEKNSAEISKDYVLDQGNKTDYNKLNSVTAQKYNLVRIAELVNSKDKAKLIISGATSGEQNEPAGIELAKHRAENITKALVNLGVDKKKIETVWAIAPANPTNQEYKEGIEENQRVDITLKNALLQEYVFEQKYAEVKGELKYSVNMQNFDDSSPAKVHFTFPDTTFSISKVGQNSLAFSKRIDESQKQIPIIAKIEKENLTQEDKIILNTDAFKKNVVDLQFKNFKAIIRFDYNSSKLSDDNKALVKELVQILPQNAVIKILGSADQLGSEASNKVLEQDRAKNTQDYIHSLDSNVKIITGANMNKYDDSTPIGRFLNRSIILTIE